MKRRYFLLLSGEETTEEELTLAAPRLGAVYNVHNRVRHGLRLRKGLETRALAQAVMDMADGVKLRWEASEPYLK